MNQKILNKKIMKRNNNSIIFTMLAMFLLASCGNLSNEVENKLNELKNKTESLDLLLIRKLTRF